VQLEINDKEIFSSVLYYVKNILEKLDKSFSSYYTHIEGKK